MNARPLAVCGVLALLAGTACTYVHSAPLAQPIGVLPAQPLVQPPIQGFVANPPGSYALQRIQPAADGWVLEDNWLPRRLSNYTHGAVTLLSFVYTYCTDPIGCPLAYATMMDLEARVLADSDLHGKVRFVSLSFDPGNDTPDAMRHYGAGRENSTALRWHFLTTYSTRFLLPILEGYGQDVEVEVDAKGSPTRTRTHMLKLFLIDPRGQVREIYSAAFLHPQVMFNDIKTLAVESAQPLAADGRQPVRR
ncbi:MAG: SCO family protein [Burkholderiaceae bacterium]